MTTVTIIAAVAANGVIGDRGELPWYIPEDLAFFKRTTLGKPVIMGRKTFDSIGKALPDRHNFVVTRDPKLRIPECTVVNSLRGALRAIRECDEPEVFLIGGGQLFLRGWSLADRMLLTTVPYDAHGDVYFPNFHAHRFLEDWRRVGETETFYSDDGSISHRRDVYESVAMHHRT